MFRCLYVHMYVSLCFDIKFCAAPNQARSHALPISAAKKFQIFSAFDCFPIRQTLMHWVKDPNQGRVLIPDTFLFHVLVDEEIIAGFFLERTCGKKIVKKTSHIFCVASVALSLKGHCESDDLFRGLVGRISEYGFYLRKLLDY